MMDTNREILINSNDLQLSKQEIRSAICAIEEKVRNFPGSLIGDTPEYLEVCPLKHTFVDKAYVREIFLPKGMIIITKIHKKTHPFFIMKGLVSVLTENGVEKIAAPYSGITPAGTKRLIYTHEDTIWITVHATEKRDLAEIEEEIIAKDFDEMEKEIFRISNEVAK